jgi:hypothetical protein
MLLLFVVQFGDRLEKRFVIDKNTRSHLFEAPSKGFEARIALRTKVPVPQARYRGPGVFFRELF